jgi:hypothetical protein
MPTRDSFHWLIDELPESELAAAARFRDDHPTRTLEGLRILPRGQAYR